jgi:hypothetical protein
VYASILYRVSSQVNARSATSGARPITRRWPQSRRNADDLALLLSLLLCQEIDGVII